MLKLKRCSTHGYTMKDVCRGEKTKSAHPPKFSTEDRYGKYRRLAKSSFLSERK